MYGFNLKSITDLKPNSEVPLQHSLQVTSNCLTAEPLLRRIKDTGNKLDAQESQLKDLSQQAKARLAKEDELARALEKKCKYLVRGLTREEVGQIMSEPAEQYLHIPSKTTSAQYRYMNKKGATRVISIGFAFNDLVDSLDGCPGKSFRP